ncbi:MAG: 4Fe-4S binding protein, partial [Betaproteobacteria bacterium]|nr:4Fe-4S binding protein [Betaproteobacteria bacterium]
MSRFLDNIRVMLGREPQKPQAITPAAEQIHKLKRLNKADFEAMKQHTREHRLMKNKWRNRRWSVLIAVNLLFVVSFWLDIQLLEGALTASRFAGFHLIDLNSALQVMLAHKHIIVNLLIGTATVFFLWVLLGGRTFCSWVCP